MSERKSVHLTPQSIAIIGDTSPGLSGRVNGIIGRYHGMAIDSMPTLPLGEWSAIIDANNGITGDISGTDIAGTIRMMAANVGDSGPDGLAEKWGVDLAALESAMSALPYAGQVAIYEVVRAFWSSPQLNELPMPDLLRQCGARIENV